MRLARLNSAKDSMGKLHVGSPIEDQQEIHRIVGPFHNAKTCTPFKFT